MTIKPPALPKPGALPRPAALPRPGALAPVAPVAPGERIRTLRERVGTGASTPVEKREKELTETQRAFREGLKREREQQLDTNDGQFWFAVYGLTRSQKEWMLRTLGLFEAGDQYLDSETFWDALRRFAPSLPPLPAVDVKLPVAKKSRRLSELAPELPKPEGE